MSLFQRFSQTPRRPVDEREQVMSERQTTAITLAQIILTDPAEWGVNSPDQCMAMATSLLTLKWMCDTGQLNEFKAVQR